MNLPNEIINKIFSYIEGNTNQLIKDAIRRYYDKKIYLNEDVNTNWCLTRITLYNTKIIKRKVNNLYRKRMLMGIEQFGNYQLLSRFEYYNFNRIIKEISCKTDCNNILLQRNILTDYIKQPNKRRKRSGTKTVLLKSQRDYIKRKTKTM